MLEGFLNFYFDKLQENDYIEIRMVSVINKLAYQIFKNFCDENNIYCKNNSQCFIKQKQLIKKLIEYKNGFIINNCKLCYSINPRQKINEEFSGGYSHTTKAHIIGFDIEKIGHEDLKEFEEILLKKYYTQLLTAFERYNLFNPMIIHSGAGIHFLYKITPQKITEEKRNWFKGFVDYLAEKYKTELFHFDALKDFTRIFALPQSINIKRNKVVKIIQSSDYVNDFKIRRKRIKKVAQQNLTFEKHKINDDITKEPLIDFMMNFKHKSLQHGAELSRNNYLELQLAYLLRDNNIDEKDIPQIINNINKNMNKTIQINTKYLKPHSFFNKNLVNKWTMKSCGIKIYD